MTNLETVKLKLFGDKLNDLISYLRLHKLNNNEGPSLLKRTEDMLAGDVEELDYMASYSKVMHCPIFDIKNGFGIYHTKCLPKKYWTKRMKALVNSGCDKAYYGCAAGDFVIIIDNVPYYIDIKISENDIAQKDDGSYIFFTGSIPVSSLNNFPNGDMRHFYILFPKDLSDPNGKICLVDGDALVAARDSKNISLRRGVNAYLAQDMFKLKNADEVITVLG